MLCRWIFHSGQFFKQQKRFGVLKYCTQNTAVEDVLRSELKCRKEVVTKLLERNPFLLEIKPDKMKKSFQRLRSLNFDGNDIKTHPRILLQSDFQLLHNFQRLREVGFTEVTAYRLKNVRKILTKSVHFNQCFNFLPKNINIMENIYTVAKVPFDKIDTYYDREIQLDSLHRRALRNYMLNFMEYASPDMDEIWFNFPSLKARSLQSFVESKQLLEDTYNLPIKQLPKFILTMEPEEIKELLTVDTVSGINVRDLMTLAPRCNLARIRDIQIVCNTYKVPDYALAFSPKLFFLNVETLKQRLDQIMKFEQYDEFLRHVSIGRVILGMGRLKIYAASQRKRFNSIFNEKFVNFFLNAYVYQTNRNHPTLFYLCKVFNKSKDEIRDALQIHPFAKDYSFRVVSKNIEYLLTQGFTLDDIFVDLNVILYSLEEFQEFFNRLKDPAETKKLNINPTEMSASQKLRLCVYLIEKKCGFNGEGIYLNSNAIIFKDEESWQMEEIIRKLNLWS